ncbi:hypothetical protein IP92_05755 [Pseudoduganella flava]|uniref:Uncharacterized protein n=1 Tax=Pseudoduganella flava TaxID=871742 RepID=A0A562P988_9BURK|nr:hypothetical protein [Pseudoduganella flava]QGZ42712.1 hypothetical protein GO485_29215 [Pseudoduganella flava]TWI41035.1 hypothetical protein IP92_05755 [Pseudoduganella flava]
MITTYAELQAAIVDRSHREDLAARIPGFIALAEAEINRRLAIFPKEVEVPLSLSVGARFIDLPADFDSPVAMWCETLQPRLELVPVVAAQMPVDEANAGQPTYWAVDGNRIAFNRPADQPYQLTLRYLQTVYLSDANPTNDLFARAPDLYFYGALAELADFLRDERDVAIYTQKFRDLLRSVAADAARSKGVAPLQTEIAAVLWGSRTRNSWGY